jgi:hypothetical protein
VSLHAVKACRVGCTFLLFTTAQYASSQPRATAVLPLGKDRSEYGAGILFGVTAVCVRLQTLTHAARAFVFVTGKCWSLPGGLTPRDFVSGGCYCTGSVRSAPCVGYEWRPVVEVDLCQCHSVPLCVSHTRLHLL